MFWRTCVGRRGLVLRVRRRAGLLLFNASSVRPSFADRARLYDCANFSSLFLNWLLVFGNNSAPDSLISNAGSRSVLATLVS